MENKQKIIVYHGCNSSTVDSIKKEIRFLPKGDPSDFTSKFEGRAFYTTTNEDFARRWAKFSANNPGDVPAVIKFELDVNDLRIYDFGKRTESDLFKQWQQVRAFFIHFPSSG